MGLRLKNPCFDKSLDLHFQVHPSCWQVLVTIRVLDQHCWSMEPAELLAYFLRESWIIGSTYRSDGTDWVRRLTVSPPPLSGGGKIRRGSRTNSPCWPSGAHWARSKLGDKKALLHLRRKKLRKAVSCIQSRRWSGRVSVNTYRTL